MDRLGKDVEREYMYAEDEVMRKTMKRESLALVRGGETSTLLTEAGRNSQRQELQPEKPERLARWVTRLSYRSNREEQSTVSHDGDMGQSFGLKKNDTGRISGERDSVSNVRITQNADM